MFCVRTKVTTRSLSRYSDYSLRHLFRFLNQDINWTYICVLFFAHFDFNKNTEYILATDETVEGKSGKHTYGISKFYSSCAKQAIKGISISALSLIDTKSKTSLK